MGLWVGRRVERQPSGRYDPSMWSLRLVLALSIVALVACGGDARNSQELEVFAAASLRDVLRPIQAGWEAQHGSKLVLNFAGTNTLAQQIHASGRGDVFIAASPQWISWLKERGRLRPGSLRPLFSNRLVVVSGSSGPRLKAPESLLDSRWSRFIIADENVPAGRYAKTWLQSTQVGRDSLWDRLHSKMAFAMDVRAALALIESDPRHLGIVYRSDTYDARRAAIRYEIPSIEQPAISYVGAIVARSVKVKLGREFLAYLQSEAVRAVLEREGFSPLAK